jgi:hypothetical protein
MDAIQTVGQRPIARTAGQIFILYPHPFGCCIHQAHEKPCDAFCTLICDNIRVCKGHLPTNDNVREAAAKSRSSVVLEIAEAKSRGSVVLEIEHLVFAHNRGIADNQDMLVQHALKLARDGLDPERMTDELIASFHEIKDLIKDVGFAKLLHEAFVGKRYVEYLDNPTCKNGAWMNYHNPTYHAEPGLERALEAHGGHERIRQDVQAMEEKFPRFAPTRLGLKDQRALMPPDEDDSEDEDE